MAGRRKSCCWPPLPDPNRLASGCDGMAPWHVALRDLSTLPHSGAPSSAPDGHTSSKPCASRDYEDEDQGTLMDLETSKRPTDYTATGSGAAPISVGTVPKGALPIPDIGGSKI